jgi:hypothetical protein
MLKAEETAMPEFMMLIADDEQARAALPRSEIADHYARIGAWWTEKERQGHIIARSGRRLQPSGTARTVRVEHATAVVTDGPFIETKEVIGGYAIVNAPDMQAAVDLVKTWPGLLVTIELRPVASRRRSMERGSSARPVARAAPRYCWTSPICVPSGSAIRAIVNSRPGTANGSSATLPPNAFALSIDARRSSTCTYTVTPGSPATRTPGGPGSGPPMPDAICATGGLLASIFQLKSSA